MPQIHSVSDNFMASWARESPCSICGSGKDFDQNGSKNLGREMDLLINLWVNQSGKCVIIFFMFFFLFYSHFKACITALIIVLNLTITKSW